MDYPTWSLNHVNFNEVVIALRAWEVMTSICESCCRVTWVVWRLMTFHIWGDVYVGFISCIWLVINAREWLAYPLCICWFGTLFLYYLLCICVTMMIAMNDSLLQKQLTKDHTPLIISFFFFFYSIRFSHSLMVVIFEDIDTRGCRKMGGIFLMYISQEGTSTLVKDSWFVNSDSILVSLDWHHLKING